MTTKTENDVDSIYIQNRWPELLSKPSDLDMVRLKHLPRDGAMKVLGSMITPTGDCTAEVEYRITRAWASFHKHGKLLQAKAGNSYERLDLLRKIVLPCLTCNLGTRMLTVAHQ